MPQISNSRIQIMSIAATLEVASLLEERKELLEIAKAANKLTSSQWVMVDLISSVNEMKPMLDAYFKE